MPDVIDVESEEENGESINVLNVTPIGVPVHRGRGYLIMHVQGGQSTLDRKDDVEFTSTGIVVRHNDPARTFTFYPWYNIVWIREHDNK